MHIFVKTLIMKKQQEVDANKMIRNPLANDLCITATQRIDYGQMITDEDTGELVPSVSLIEKDRNVKIFYGKGCKEMVYNLSPGAKSLYLFVLYNLEPNQDWIQINSQWYMTKNSIKSINTYKEALKELCRYLFLSPTLDYKDVFWINPMLFFCGNRINKYPDKVKISATPFYVSKK